MLAVAPWQVLLLANVPIAVLAMIGIRAGIAADTPDELHRDPVDVPGAALGTVTVVLALVAPTLFVDRGAGSWAPWVVSAAAVAAGVLFVVRERSTAYPILDLELLKRPPVAAGLAYKAATGLAVAGLGYLVTLQLQLDWGWSPAMAALGLLPQVVVLVAAGPFVNRFVDRAGLERAAWLGAIAVVAGLATYALLGRLGYVWVAIALALVAAAIRVVGAVAGVNVLRGLPPNRTSIGAALVDTASEFSSAAGIAATGTILAALFTGAIAAPRWTAHQHAEFATAATLAGVTLTLIAAALVAWAGLRSRDLVGSA